LPLNETVISVLESVASHLGEILAAKEAENKAQCYVFVRWQLRLILSD